MNVKWVMFFSLQIVNIKLNIIKPTESKINRSFCLQYYLDVGSTSCQEYILGLRQTTKFLIATGFWFVAARWVFCC